MAGPGPEKLRALTCLLTLTACGGGGGTAQPTSITAVPQTSTPAAVPAALPATVAEVATPTPTPTPAVSAPAATVIQAPTTTPVPTEKATVLADKVFYARGSYGTYASPWCSFLSSQLKVGTDLVDTITLYDSKFPDSIEVNSASPDRNPNDFGCGVFGYHFLAFGNYDSSIVPVPITPQKAKGIRTLSAEVDATSRDSKGDRNVLAEFYLTQEAGNLNNKLVEVGYFLHASPTALAFAKTGKLIGSYVDPSNRAWTIYQAAKFVMLFPTDGRDVEQGTLDMKHLLDALIAKGVITGDEWFNGVAVGLEPVRGVNRLMINRWRVTYN